MSDYLTLTARVRPGNLWKIIARKGEDRNRVERAKIRHYEDRLLPYADKKGGNRSQIYFAGEVVKITEYAVDYLETINLTPARILTYALQLAPATTPDGKTIDY